MATPRNGARSYVDCHAPVVRTLLLLQAGNMAIYKDSQSGLPLEGQL